MQLTNGNVIEWRQSGALLAHAIWKTRERKSRHGTELKKSNVSATFAVSKGRVSARVTAATMNRADDSTGCAKTIALTRSTAFAQLVLPQYEHKDWRWRADGGGRRP